MSGSVAKQDFEMYAGDACDIILVYKDSSGSAIPTITKATITLKDYYGATLKIQKVAILDAPNAKMTFTFTGTETDSLVPITGAAIPEVKYIHDVELELSSGLSPITIIRGEVVVTGDIT